MEQKDSAEAAETYIGRVQNPDEWATAVKTTYDFLVGVATEGGKAEYGDVYRQVEAATGMKVGPYQDEDLLREVTEKSIASHSGVLSSLVINKKTRQPGKGFFKLIAEKGLADLKAEPRPAIVRRLQKECWAANT